MSEKQKFDPASLVNHDSRPIEVHPGNARPSHDLGPLTLERVNEGIRLFFDSPPCPAPSPKVKG